MEEVAVKAINTDCRYPFAMSALEDTKAPQHAPGWLQTKSNLLTHFHILLGQSISRLCCHNTSVVGGRRTGRFCFFPAKRRSHFSHCKDVLAVASSVCRTVSTAYCEAEVMLIFLETRPHIFLSTYGWDIGLRDPLCLQLLFYKLFS